MRYSPFLSCRRAATLITASMDGELGPLDRAALAVHLRLCVACPKVVRQFDAMRRSMQDWRAEVEGADPLRATPDSH